MANKLETKVTDLATQGGKIAAGATEHGATIAMGNNTAANIAIEVEALATAIAVVAAAKTELSKRHRAVRLAAAEGRAFLFRARHSFHRVLGYTHNVLWNETGLVNSLRIPEAELGVLQLLGSFRFYLGAHPSFEVVAEEISAAKADLLYNSLDVAGVAVNSQRTITRQAMLNRNTKAKQLRIRLRGTIHTLEQELGPIDPRWASFGLNQPGTKAKPDAPGKLTTTAVIGNAVSLKWNKTARAKYYRVWKKVVGMDADFIPMGSPADPDFTLENLPFGVTVEIAVSAVNNGGESAFSPLLVVQIA